MVLVLIILESVEKSLIVANFESNSVFMDQLRKLSFDDRLKEKIILLILESLQNSDNTNKTNNLESIYEGATDKSKLNSMSTIHDSKMWSSTHFNFVRVESNDYQKESHFIKKHDLPENSSDNDDSDNEEIDFKDMNNTLPEVNTQRLSKVINILILNNFLN